MKLKWKKPTKLNINVCERGSSSVLVIMIMLLLITFGVLAMMSSYSNLKIARKHAQWTSDFYHLESIADSDLKSFEQLFGRAMDDTQSNFVNQTLDLQTIEDMPDEIKESLLNKVNAISTSDTIAINSVADQLFLYHLYEAYMTAPLFDKHYSSNFDDNIFTESIESGWVPEITFITKDEATERQLLVKIAIDVSKDDILSNELSILEWREIPAEFEYDETLDFEDPEGN